MIKDATSGFPEKQITSNPKLKDKMRLTLIDSPGYGDKSDIKEWRKSISDVLTYSIAFLCRRTCKPPPGKAACISTDKNAERTVKCK